MGLLDNLKNKANLDKLKDQAMKRASQLVDKAQEKLSEMQSNEEEKDVSETKSNTATRPSKREQTVSPREERPVQEKRDEKPLYQAHPDNRMFSKELEALIYAALEDGVLEDYEKAAIARRAQAEGVDFAELEIYINSILHRRKKEQARREEERLEAIDQKKKEAFGRVCPNCGKQVPPLTLRCECGYEFTSNNHVSSVQLLADKIEKIRTRPIKVKKSFWDPEGDKSRYLGEKQRDQELYDVIVMFPVPNTKEDIVEFCSLAISQSRKKKGLNFNPIMSLKCGKSVDVSQAWRDKLEQVLIKGRSLRGDPEFTQQLDYYENLLNKK